MGCWRKNAAIIERIGDWEAKFLEIDFTVKKHHLSIWGRREKEGRVTRSIKKIIVAAEVEKISGKGVTNFEKERRRR